MKAQPLDFEKPIFDLEKRIEDLKKHSRASSLDLDPELQSMENKIVQLRAEIYSNLTAWQRVQIARHTARPFYLDYLEDCFTDFVELHGDRLFGDDPAMPGGLATIGEYRCVVIGHQKGRNTKENVHRNFGSANPEGYRKALRLMRLAEKFGLPVVSLIDTPGAYPGVGAEERHIAEAIAVNIREMMLLKIPIVSVVIGEGGSGGALGIGVADHVLIMENAYYSVISPEGCAAILWKHRSFAPEAAEALKLSSKDLVELGLVEGVVPEPEGVRITILELPQTFLKDSLLASLNALTRLPSAERLQARYQKFRHFGRFLDPDAA